MFYSVETKRLLIWKCQRHYLIITRIITSKWDNFSKSDKNLSTFVSTLANFWKFFVRNTSSALYHFSYFSWIDYFTYSSEIISGLLFFSSQCTKHKKWKAAAARICARLKCMTNWLICIFKWSHSPGVHNFAKVSFIIHLLKFRD